jgi:hypothetical protein
MTQTTISSLDKNAFYDSFRVQDHEAIIVNQIQLGENPNHIEEYISNVEAAFQVELHELRLSLAISIYNQEQSFDNFNKLIPFMKNITSYALEFNDSNNALFTLPENVIYKIQSILDQIQKPDTFYELLQGLQYGSPLVISIFNEVRNNKNKSIC